jgi:hypothetical protein
VSTKQLAVGYLWAQAAIVGSWWLVLWLWPAARAPFVVGDWPEPTLLAFWLADMLVLVLGSAVAASGFRRQQPWTRPLLWGVAGAVVYATLFCVGSNLVTGRGLLGTALMLPCCAGTLLCLRWTAAR